MYRMKKNLKNLKLTKHTLKAHLSKICSFRLCAIEQQDLNPFSNFESSRATH